MSVFHGVAPAAVEAMLYCLVEGTLLGAFVYLALRLVSRKNSGTRFVLWFSTLVAVILVPFLTLPPRAVGGNTAPASSSSHGIFTLPVSWTIPAFLLWVLIAVTGLLRVAIGFRQVLRLRKSCSPIDLATLSPEVQEVVGQFQRSRSVVIGTSPKLNVPTAIGFRKPAVLLPAWLVAEASPTELKHILLHELEHLRRRDDWTNLAQKLIKALLFFHPLVWWIEGRLSLERELACDDAVLAHTKNPRVYAQCLARMAEKSFLRRQIALAQAAVSRMSQLSSRVAEILDLDRPKTIHLWKPAIPLVVVAALICGLFWRKAPALVSFTEEAVHSNVASDRVAVPSSIVKSEQSSNDSDRAASGSLGAQMVDARFTIGSDHPHPLPVKAMKRHSRVGNSNAKTEWRQPANMMLANYSGYVIAQEEFVVSITSEGQWQVQVWQLRLLVPSNQAEQPKPRKT